MFLTSSPYLALWWIPLHMPIASHRWSRYLQPTKIMSKIVYDSEHLNTESAVMWRWCCCWWRRRVIYLQNICPSSLCLWVFSKPRGEFGVKCAFKLKQISTLHRKHYGSDFNQSVLVIFKIAWLRFFTHNYQSVNFAVERSSCIMQVALLMLLQIDVFGKIIEWQLAKRTKRRMHILVTVCWLSFDHGSTHWNSFSNNANKYIHEFNVSMKSIESQNNFLR